MPDTRATQPFKEQPRTAQQLFNEICDRVAKADSFQEFIYLDIEPEVGSICARSFSVEPRVERRGPRINYNPVTKVFRVKVMPTEIHNCHVHWLKNELGDMVANGFLTLNEYKSLDFNVGTTFTGFPGIYTGASKEPDLLIRPDTDNFPSVVVESGWSESWPHLQADMRLWFSAPNINYVILLKWTKLSNNKVKGRIEVWHRNLAGVATLLHSEAIFPQPTVTRQIPITMAELFGAHLPPNNSPNNTFQLSLNELRPIASERLRIGMGLNPA